LRIGIVDIDSRMPNLALMKLSAFHKSVGDSVKIYDPLFDHPDRIYSSKVFKSSDKFGYFPKDCEVIQGGSGHDLTIKLPDEVETMYPDYSLYNCNYAIGFTTRGCTRECGFCIVPKKEGKLHPVADIHQFWNGQKELFLMDNNLTGDTEHFNLILNQLIKYKIKTDFNQGLDIRLIDDEKAKLLSKVRLWKQIHFAFDSLDLETEVRAGIEILLKYMPASRLMFYVLVGWDTTEDEDLYRIEILRSYKIDPFVMVYDKTSEYQRRLARWCNFKAIFKTVAWPDYKKRG